MDYMRDRQRSCVTSGTTPTPSDDRLRGYRMLQNLNQLAYTVKLAYFRSLSLAISALTLEPYMIR